MTRRLVGWTGELLLTLGVLLLLFAAWQLWWTDVVADRAQSEIVSTLEDDFALERPPAPVGADGIPAALGDAGAFAVVRIPRFGADYARPLLEGTDRPVLELGLGHYVGTAGPGQVGNFAIAGHRTTHGRPLHDVDRLVDGDRVVVETAATVHVYEVVSREVVRPSDVAVIAPVPGEPGAAPTEAVLTMTTCHPRYAATERFVVHGRLAATVPRAQWDPARWLTPPTEG